MGGSLVEKPIRLIFVVKRPNSKKYELAEFSELFRVPFEDEFAMY